MLLSNFFNTSSTKFKSLEFAAAIVLGENIGTTITANLAALIGNIHAKRAAVAHLMFNVFGVLWMLVLFYFVIDTIEQLMVNNDLMLPLDQSSPEKLAYSKTQWSLATFHLVFNIANTSLLLWFIPFIQRTVIKLIPIRDEDDEHFFLTAPDTLLYTYSPKFFGSDEGGEGVLFTMNKSRELNINYTKPPESGRERVTPTRNPNNKYWCLSRHMYLLGKQLLKCDDKARGPRHYGCYKDQRLDVIEGNTINSLGLTYSPKKERGGKRRRTRHRKGRRSKKGVARKARKKTRWRRRRRGKKSKKH